MVWVCTGSGRAGVGLVAWWGPGDRETLGSTLCLGWSPDHAGGAITMGSGLCTGLCTETEVFMIQLNAQRSGAYIIFMIWFLHLMFESQSVGDLAQSGC